MELYQIKTFVVVACEGNLTRAAKRLHASQSTISLHIKSLEEELDVCLFLRTPKGMVSTPEGEVLLKRAQDVLDSVEKMQAEANSLRGDVSGEARVGLQTSPVYLRTPQLIKCIKEYYPGLNLQFIQNHTWTIRREVVGRAIEGGFFYSVYPPDEMEGIILENTVLRVVGPVSWRDKMENAKWEDLAKLPWIWTPAECSFSQKLNEKFHSLGLEASKSMIADSEDAHNALVRFENGVTVMRDDEAREGEEGGSFYIWPGGHLEVGLYFGFHKQRMADPIVKALIDCVEKVWKS
ncbi:LysR family transcriptional regulator [Maridesulfovibrio ferrireducens]|uniref:LysR family transcriptional regulator n=1 Tax=Maridesulfovibrio ferrireducens TaxID=246191 RepID=UPI001A2AD4B8|nr:LysR family transcriptional regulator [Maridesulfovibrio ferrireducens]MBI9112060.1 LysR family transcriptional regulator [Maridesulfovibrio ferrireducens]